MTTLNIPLLVHLLDEAEVVLVWLLLPYVGFESRLHLLSFNLLLLRLFWHVQFMDRLLVG